MVSIGQLYGPFVDTSWRIFLRIASPQDWSSFLGSQSDTDGKKNSP